MIELKLTRYRWHLSPAYRPLNHTDGRNIFRSPLVLEKGKLKKMVFGLEGIIDLKNEIRVKKDLLKQVKRGLRAGKVVEISPDRSNLKKINYLKKIIKNTRKAELKYIYPQSISSRNRIFIHREPCGHINAAVTISRHSGGIWYMEQILRHPHAPAGVMESLIHSIIVRLKTEGHSKLSLGEVPFMADKETSFRDKLFLNSGKIVLGKIYNYKGLYKFKNKFSPQWKTTYLYGTPKIPLLTLAELFFKSKMYKLVFYNFLSGNKS
jgi:hypothetical protein